MAAKILNGFEFLPLSILASGVTRARENITGHRKHAIPSIFDNDSMKNLR